MSPDSVCAPLICLKLLAQTHAVLPKPRNWNCPRMDRTSPLRPTRFAKSVGVNVKNYSAQRHQNSGLPVLLQPLASAYTNVEDSLRIRASCKTCLFSKPSCCRTTTAIATRTRTTKTATTEITAATVTANFGSRKTNEQHNKQLYTVMKMKKDKWLKREHGKPMKNKENVRNMQDNLLYNGKIKENKTREMWENAGKPIATRGKSMNKHKKVKKRKDNQWKTRKTKK